MLPALAAAVAAPPPVPLGPPPGVVVTASPNPQKVFVASPSIGILADGSYVVSHDSRGHTFVKASSDRGATWRPLADLAGQKWSTLFVHRGALYLIGVGTPKGHMIIRRSHDGGRTWTEPRDARSGLLAEGNFHCGPTPVVVHGGRIWRAFEEFALLPPTRRFSAFVMSAPEEADLLVAANWTRSNEIAFRSEWLNTRTAEWLEGNVVVTPAGDLVDILRVESHPAAGAAFVLPGAAAHIPRFEVAAMLDVSPDGRRVSFDPARGFIHFIGSESKFTIRYDPVARCYWTVGNKITNPASGADWTHSPHHQRNVLVLASSTDLREWTERYRLLSHAAGSVVVKEGSRVGFQYPDWQFDGDDLVVVTRTCWDGLNYHDANYILFHRLKNFRALTPADSPPDLAAPVAR
jgi:hypothetical protein